MPSVDKWRDRLTVQGLDIPVGQEERTPTPSPQQRTPVPVRPTPGPTPFPTPTNVNTADVNVLMRLEPIRRREVAQRIVDWVAENGPFDSVEQMEEEIKGIGKVTADALVDLITFGIVGRRGRSQTPRPDIRYQTSRRNPTPTPQASRALPGLELGSGKARLSSAAR